MTRRPETGSFAGVFPAIVTPYGRGRRVNETAVRAAMEFNIEAALS